MNIDNVPTDDFTLDPSHLLWAVRLSTAGVSSLWTAGGDRAETVTASFVVLRVEGHLHLDGESAGVEDVVEIALDFEQCAALTQLITRSVMAMAASAAERPAAGDGLGGRG